MNGTCTLIVSNQIFPLWSAKYYILVQAVRYQNSLIGSNGKYSLVLGELLFGS